MDNTTNAPGQKPLPIRDVYQPTDEQRDTIRTVYKRRKQMEDSTDRQKAIGQWDQWEKQYEAWREARLQDDWQSNHVTPLTLSIVETALSEIIQQNLRPFILPRGDEDTMKAQVMQYIWEFAWEISDGDSVTYDIIKDMLMFGTAIAQEYYRVDKRKVGAVSTDGKAITTAYKEVTDYDDVCTEVVKLQDFFVDEFARGFTGPYAARDCIRRYIMDIHEFHRMYDNSVWDQFGDADKVRAGGDRNHYEFFRPPEGMNTNDQVEVLHYWNKPTDKFIIVANDVLVRDGSNPYKHKELPFARAVDIKRVHRFYGKGEPELLESIQDELNTLRRMIIDRNHLDIDKMFLISNKLGLEEEDLMARPHGLIPTDDPNGVRPIEYGDIPRSVEMSIQNLEDDSTISTGIDPRAQALPQAGTATEASILKESTLKRISLKIWLIKKEYLMRIARLRMANILQFYPQPKIEEVLGDKRTQEYQQSIATMQQAGTLTTIGGKAYQKKFKTVRTPGKQMNFDAKGNLASATSITGHGFFQLRPEYFMPVADGGFDIKYDVGANIEISKPLMQQQNLDLFDRFAKIALEVPGSYDIVKLGDNVLRDYNKNPDDLKPDQPTQDPNGQRQQMQIQMASMENTQMMRGIPVPATPFSSPIHTRIHITFMQSPDFTKLGNDSPIIKNFTNHVTGEMMAQEQRNQQAGMVTPTQQPGQPQQPQPEPPKVSVQIKADALSSIGQEMLKEEGLLHTPPTPTQPGQDPNAQDGQSGQAASSQTQPTSLAQGQVGKPGQMNTPQVPMGKVNPAINNGGNKSPLG